MTRFFNYTYSPMYLYENVLIWGTFCISVLIRNSALI